MWKLRQLVAAIRARLKAYSDQRQLAAREKAWQSIVERAGHDRNGQILLHIGCGDINARGFINVDARSKPHIHIVTRNLFSLDMIPSESANLVYMSHVLEHVGHREVVKTLKEMRRVLRPGGVLRVSVPDFDYIVDIYNATSRNIAAIEQPLMGGQDYPFNFHYCVFNSRHLQDLMLKSGFQSTRSWNPATCEHHDFQDWASMNIEWQGRQFPISLNIEAVK